MSMMDVTVRSSPIGHAVAQIDLGAPAGSLSINVQHSTDRFVRVHVRWARRSGDEPQTVGFGYLDTREGDICSVEEAARRGGKFAVAGQDERGRV